MAAPWRMTAGTKVAQIAARPEPIAMAGAANASDIARLHRTTLGTLRVVSTLAVSVATTTATRA